MDKEAVSINFTVDFHQPVKAFCLVVGGWFPLSFTPESVVLVDRNVLGILKEIDNTTERSDHKANKWWFSFINSPLYTLNPVLSAMEGNKKKAPSPKEFKEELESNISLLKKKLPLSKVVFFQENNYQLLYEIVENLLSRRKKETKFLLEVAPLIKERLSDNKIFKIESEIFESLKRNNVSSLSLVTLAVLSCLYEHKNGTVPSIGKKLLKPTAKYNETQAYNSLSDIGYIEMLISMQTFFNNNVSFITRDKALAAFWCALKIKNHNTINGKVNYTVSLNEKLFPRLSDNEIKKLQLRLEENKI